MIGKKIRDIEDTDCYYEGIIVSTDPIKYEVSRVVWNGEEDSSMNGEITELKWWFWEYVKQ